MPIRPKNLEANGLWNHFTGRKRYTIQCGGCAHSWTEKVPFALSDRASAICPNCRAQNIWSHSEFGRYYDKIVDKSAN